jgi:hypothetical protein
MTGHHRTPRHGAGRGVLCGLGGVLRGHVRAVLVVGVVRVVGFFLGYLGASASGLSHVLFLFVFVYCSIWVIS